MSDFSFWFWLFAVLGIACWIGFKWLRDMARSLPGRNEDMVLTERRLD